MRFHATKERRRDRDEFVYKYRNEVKELIERDNPNAIKKFVTETVRKELEYSASTYYSDIFFMLRRSFYKLFPQHKPATW